MHQLKNDILQVSIDAKGAELQSIIKLDDQQEYMWGGDPGFWGKKSPVLFPIVGGLKNNSYQFRNNTYSLPRHGFAREKVFTVSNHTDTSITFTLTHDEGTRKVYPFDFRFSIIYTLDQSNLRIGYEVENTGTDTMYFSVGAHPAFAVPLVAGTDYTDHYLLFSHEETTGKWPLSADGLIRESPEDFFKKSTRLDLAKELFYGDALVFKDLRSTSISILNTKNAHGLTVHYTDFPFMGIWSAKNADFVCIEPWCGIADSVDTTGNIEEKEGINILPPHDRFSRSWTIEIF